MDRYHKVEKPRQESAINENEIRITSQGIIRNYVSYATSLVLEKRVGEIVLKAMGQAISKAVAIAEIIKKRIPGLYQDTAISSVPSTSRAAKASAKISTTSTISTATADSTKIFMHEDVVEVEEEKEGGVGEEDMVAMVDMTITRVAMATIKEDMVVMVTIKVDMVDIAMIGMMVDGTPTGVEVVDVVEVVGIIVVEPMEEVEEMVEEPLGEVMVVVEEGWLAVREKTRTSVMLGLKNLCKLGYYSKTQWRH